MQLKYSPNFSFTCVFIFKKAYLFTFYQENTGEQNVSMKYLMMLRVLRLFFLIKLKFNT